MAAAGGATQLDDAGADPTGGGASATGGAAVGTGGPVAVFQIGPCRTKAPIETAVAGMSNMLPGMPLESVQACLGFSAVSQTLASSPSWGDLAVDFVLRIRIN